MVVLVKIEEVSEESFKIVLNISNVKQDLNDKVEKNVKKVLVRYLADF